MGIKITGLDNLKRELNRQAKAASGNVKLTELFPPDFMRKYSDCPNFEHFWRVTGLEAMPQEEFDRMPEAEMDKLVAKHTRFKTWDEMKQTAGALYVKKKIKL